MTYEQAINKYLDAQHFIANAEMFDLMSKPMIEKCRRTIKRRYLMDLRRIHPTSK